MIFVFDEKHTPGEIYHPHFLSDAHGRPLPLQPLRIVREVTIKEWEQEHIKHGAIPSVGRMPAYFYEVESD
jgi:hypothetical protein